MPLGDVERRCRLPTFIFLVHQKINIKYNKNGNSKKFLANIQLYVVVQIFSKSNGEVTRTSMNSNRRWSEKRPRNVNVGRNCMFTKNVKPNDEFITELLFVKNNIIWNMKIVCHKAQKLIWDFWFYYLFLQSSTVPWSSKDKQFMLSCGATNFHRATVWCAQLQ